MMLIMLRQIPLSRNGVDGFRFSCSRRFPWRSLRLFRQYLNQKTRTYPKTRPGCEMNGGPKESRKGPPPSLNVNYSSGSIVVAPKPPVMLPTVPYCAVKRPTVARISPLSAWSM